MDIYYLEQFEKYSALLSILSFYLGAKQRTIIWPISIITSAINLLLYYYRKTLGSFLQNIICILFSLYGWYTWRYGGKHHTELNTITKTSPKESILLLLGVSIYVVILNQILICLDSAFTFLDSLRSALTMVGMWLSSHKKLETYLLWFIVNLVSILLFHQLKMNWFSLKYFFFLCGSLYSYRMWWKQYQEQKGMGDS